MQDEKPWLDIIATGKTIMDGWQKLSSKYDLPLSTKGLPSLAAFNFNSPNNLGYKTLITQNMLEQGFLAANSVYVCSAHTKKDVSTYFNALEPIFALIQECEQGRDVMAELKGPICHAGFSRLN
jgi:glutamate-1-semialdehyde 2,1-aminomutase